MLILKTKLARLKDDYLHSILPIRIGPKVFCIGYNKTGTTSCGHALKMLGYKHTSFNYRIYRKFYKKGDYHACVEFAQKFDSFDDLPWLNEDMIPILDKMFEAKFIHLHRGEGEWAESLAKWRAKYKEPVQDMQKELEAYRKHTAFVLNYFKDKENMITLSIADPQGFKKMAEFLGKQAPQDSFPHLNKSG